MRVDYWTAIFIASYVLAFVATSFAVRHVWGLLIHDFLPANRIISHFLYVIILLFTIAVYAITYFKGTDRSAAIAMVIVLPLLLTANAGALLMFDWLTEKLRLQNCRTLYSRVFMVALAPFVVGVAFVLD